MAKSLELSEETHQWLWERARQQQQTPEELIRRFIIDQELEPYRQANQSMLAQGILAALPTMPPAEKDEDLEPEPIPGKSLAEIIIEDRR